MATSSRTTKILGFGILTLVVLAGVGWWYRTTRPDYRLAQGQQAARAGDYLKASKYISLLDRAGAREHSLLLRGEIQYLQNDPLLALSTLNQITSKETGIRSQAVYLSGRCWLSLRDLRDAERAFQYVIDVQPDHVDARRGLASVYYDLGDYLKALPLLQEIADLDHKDGRALRLTGLIYKDMEKFSEAAPSYEESLHRDPNSSDAAEIRLELAECWLALARPKDVLRILESDSSAPAAALLAQALIALGQVDQATVTLDRALKLYPDHITLRRIRAEQFRVANDPASGVRLLEPFVAKFPYDFRSREQLALCYQAIGKESQAAEQFRQVKAIQDLLREINKCSNEAMQNTWDPKVRFRLAELFEKLGRPELAQMWQNAAQACRDAQ